MYPSDQLEAALEALDRQPRKISAAKWSGHLSNLDVPGLYAWWVDEEGARDISEGIGLPMAAGRIYVGQAGATRWPSGDRPSSTLRTRIRGSHLGSRIGKSTFRYTLAASLRRVLDLKVIGHRELDKRSERRLSQWMGEHLEVAVHPFSDRDTLKDLENQVLAKLDPPLNLNDVEQNDVRTKIEKLRENLRKPSPTTVSIEKADLATPKSSVKLHEEIVDILQEHVEGLTTEMIAALVNKRGRYRKRDCSAVTAFQIHGRIKNYPHIFDRDGTRARLKNPPSH
jgi:hypothetical protein